MLLSNKWLFIFLSSKRSSLTMLVLQRSPCSNWKEEYPSAFESKFLSGILVLNCKIPLCLGMIPSVKHAIYTLKI